MSESVRELFEKARQLTIDERIELADLLSMSKMISEEEWQRIGTVESDGIERGMKRQHGELSN